MKADAGKMRDDMLTGSLVEIYDLLYERFGPQRWWPAKTQFEVIVGAILTQSTSWRNVEKAISNLENAGVLSVEGILKIDIHELAELICPSGYYNMKARKLKAIVSFLSEGFGSDLDTLFDRPLDEVRRDLLGVYGVGPETADSILLYAGGRPSFVVDAYTRRIFGRLGLLPPELSYEQARSFFMENLPSSARLYNEYHALIVRLAKENCTSRNPKCDLCPIRHLAGEGSFCRNRA
jgi:endonuclease-3 related protein